VLGTILHITNSYVYNGDARSSEEFAPLSKWGRKFAFKFFIVFLCLAAMFKNEIWLACTFNFYDFGLVSVNTYSPGERIISIFPSLIGFGIGVYALLISISDSIVKELQENIEKSSINSGSALMLSSDLAFPLLVLILTLIVGVVQVSFDRVPFFILLAWFMIWYSFIVIIEMLGVLFGITNNSLLDKL
jgi:hypothetical protein